MRSCAREETRESRECLVYSLTPSGFWAENHPKIGVSSPSDRRASCTTPLHRGPAWPPSAQLLHPTGDGLPDLVRRVFLDVMAPRDRHLGQCRQAADEGEILVVGEDRTGLDLEEQLGHIALRTIASMNAMPFTAVCGKSHARNEKSPLLTKFRDYTNHVFR